jgi:predicted nucleic acid-binding protein
LPLVVDASVGLKWILQEDDSHLAHALATGEEELLVPDFWLHEACDVMWLQVHRRLLTPEEACEGLSLLRALVEPTPTGELALHDVALDIALAIDHSPYDTMYIAFAIAMGARAVVMADGAFSRNMRMHPAPAIANLVLPLKVWAAERPC